MGEERDCVSILPLLVSTVTPQVETLTVVAGLEINVIGWIAALVRLVDWFAKIFSDRSIRSIRATGSALPEYARAFSS
jgi:hypothetical protein